MEALEALQQRVSSPKLMEPGPTLGEREAIYRAATRAADHGMMRPWRFLVVEGAGLDHLGELFCQAALEDDANLSVPDQASLRRKPRRAPLILIAIAQCRDNPKVPELEQLLCAGAAVQNMLNAAYAQGIGAFWRTGKMAYHPVVERGLELTEQEKIIGFLYLGTPAKPFHPPKPVDLHEVFTPWPPQ